MTPGKTTGPGVSWVPSRIDGVLTAEVDGDLVLMHPVEYTYFGLSSTGVAVWDRIDGSRDVEAILSELSQQFEGGEEEIRTDVLDFLGGLSSAKLIDLRDRPRQ